MEELDLRYIMSVFLKRKIVIIITTLLLFSFTVFYSFMFLKTEYTATSFLLVISDRDSNVISRGEIDASRTMAQSYLPLIERRLVLEQVIENLNLPDSLNMLRGRLSISRVDSTELISITIKYAHPLQAVNIVNEVSDVFVKEISGIYFSDNLVKIEPAVNAVPVRPRHLLNAIAGIILGLTLGVGIAFFMEFLEDTIKTTRDISRYLNLPVLGNLPVSPLKVKSFKCRDPLTAAYRFLVNNIQYLGLDKSVKSLLVTPTNIEGINKTISPNLGVMLSKGGSSVLLIDAVFGNPTLHKLFNVPNEKGFSDMIIDKNFVSSDYIKETENENLHLITGGLTGANANLAKPLSLIRLKEILNDFENDYDFIIFNTPVLITYTDVAVISAYADATIIVFDYGQVRKEDAISVKEKLERGRANIVGAVINKIPADNNFDFVLNKKLRRNKIIKKDIDKYFPI